MIECLASGKLLLRQHRDSLPASFDVNAYDLALCAISWESRCTFAMTHLSSRFRQLHALRFETSDREDTRKLQFAAELQAVTDNLAQIQLGKSTSYAENFRVLDAFLESKVVTLGHPLRVICDITCIPKSYLLFLIGLGFEKGYFARLDCLYSEGNYAIVPRTSGTIDISAESGPISEGRWDSLSVPFFEAETTIPSARDLLVTLGGELGLTVPFIEKYEPMRLGLVGLKGGNIGDPSSLKDVLTEPNVVQYSIDVCDAVGVAKAAEAFCSESNVDVVTALAVGSKPHALGLGVAKLAQRKMEVVCRVPKRYTMLNVPPSSTLMLYEIEDRFEPRAYLTSGVRKL